MLTNLARRHAAWRVLMAVALGCSVVGGAFGGESTVIDLTHPFDADTIYWPTEDGFTLDKGPAGVTDRGYFYAANRFSAPEHGGTHIDAPYHFAAQGQTVDQIPPERLIGPGACVDVRSQCRADRDYLVTVEDLKRWETDQGASLEDRIVLLRTGFAEHWGDRTAYLGTKRVGRAAVDDLHFPGLDPAAAQWLCTVRRVRAVGIDTPSIDNGPSRDFQSHVNLFKHNTPALENVASMRGLPRVGFEVIPLPMLIAEGTGAPCRVIAAVGEANSE